MMGVDDPESLIAEATMSRRFDYGAGDVRGGARDAGMCLILMADPHRLAIRRCSLQPVGVAASRSRLVLERP